jgi:ligand-binding sensor domain-containing protein
MRAPGLLCFGSTLLLVATSVVAQELPFTHYTADRETTPLPSTGVTSVYQDRLGYLWIGAEGAGLVRYDGHSMERFGQEDGLVDLSPTDFVEDDAGRLWVASMGGLVVSERPLDAYSQGGRPRFTSRLDSVSLFDLYVNPNCLVADEEGGVWVGTTADGVIHYRIEADGRLAVDTLRTDLHGAGQNESVYSLFVRHDGSLWVGLAEGALLTFDRKRGRFEQVQYEGDVLKETTTVLHESASGTLWGGSFAGTVWRLTGPRGGTRGPWRRALTRRRFRVGLAG